VPVGVKMAAFVDVVPRSTPSRYFRARTFNGFSARLAHSLN
jgi:hypothetical protein